MTKKEWIKQLLKKAESINISPVFKNNNEYFLQYVSREYNSGTTPDECIKNMQKSAATLNPYFSESSKQPYSINDITRETRDVIGMDTVNRELHQPSIEELAKMFKIDIDQIKKELDEN